jgi:hypothetical protein
MRANTASRVARAIAAVVAGRVRASFLGLLVGHLFALRRHLFAFRPLPVPASGGSLAAQALQGSRPTRWAAFAVLLALCACASSDEVRAPQSAGNRQEWQLVTGKPPSPHEFAAVVAACQDRELSLQQPGSLDGCLVDLGLRREQ